jgi:transposase
VERRVDGQALLRAIRYEVAKLRCSAGGQIFTAGLPAGVGEATDSPQARAVLAVGRSVLGLPLYRIEASQARLGVPVPEATQWDQSEAVGDCAYKVLAQMAHEAAQGELIFHDDTAVRLVALMQANLALVAAAQADGLSTPQARTGRPTTALVVKVGEPTAIVYDSSRRQAGEHLQGLLDQRAAGLATPRARSDALASTEVRNDAAVLRWHCLAHGRRQCSDRTEAFPRACQVVLEGLSAVCDHEEQARQAQMSPAARWASHQAQSRPLLDGLHRWLATQLDAHLVAPNSSLGKAMGSMPKPWETLTRFLHLPGALLDTKIAERALTLWIRQRNNALFYNRTPRASMASVLTRLSATCVYAGINAVASLVALHEHRREVCADPAAWLPWAYAHSRASPEATRRPACAIWARSGWPFQSTSISARAERGTRASGLWGHHAKGPCERRCIILP